MTINFGKLPKNVEKARTKKNEKENLERHTESGFSCVSVLKLI